LHGDFDGKPMPLSHAKKLKALLEGAGRLILAILVTRLDL
jgi:hypothetical protein